MEPRLFKLFRDKVGRERPVHSTVIFCMSYERIWYLAQVHVLVVSRSMQQTRKSPFPSGVGSGKEKNGNSDFPYSVAEKSVTLLISELNTDRMIIISFLVML